MTEPSDTGAAGKEHSMNTGTDEFGTPYDQTEFPMSEGKMETISAFEANEKVQHWRRIIASPYVGEAATIRAKERLALFEEAWNLALASRAAAGTTTDPKSKVLAIERMIQQLAAGAADELTEPEYEALADKCEELSRYLDSIAESFRIASSPEATAALAALCNQVVTATPSARHNHLKSAACSASCPAQGCENSDARWPTVAPVEAKPLGICETLKIPHVHGDHGAVTEGCSKWVEAKPDVCPQCGFADNNISIHGAGICQHPWHSPRTSQPPAEPAPCPKCEAKGPEEAGQKCCGEEGCPIDDYGYHHEWPTQAQLNADIAEAETIADAQVDAAVEEQKSQAAPRPAAQKSVHEVKLTIEEVSWRLWAIYNKYGIHEQDILELMSLYSRREALYSSSSATPIDSETVKKWIADLRESCHANYNGGHHNAVTREAFHHGMDTICNCLDAYLANWINKVESPSATGEQELEQRIESITWACNERERLQKKAERELAELQSKYDQVSAAHDIVCGRHVELETEIVRARKDYKLACTTVHYQEKEIEELEELAEKRSKELEETLADRRVHVDRAFAAETLAEKRGAALRKYGRHLQECRQHLSRPDKVPCTCGLAEASASAPAKETGEGKNAGN